MSRSAVAAGCHSSSAAQRNCVEIQLPRGRVRIARPSAPRTLSTRLTTFCLAAYFVPTPSSKIAERCGSSPASSGAVASP